jgi:choice-of-anchor C domain-containing protein
MNRAAPFALLAAILVVCSSAHAAPFANGDFEATPAKSPFTTIGGSGSIGPWNAKHVDHIGTYWHGYGGTGQSVDLNSTKHGSISQTFDTVAGQTYEVTFALSRNSDPLGLKNFGTSPTGSLDLQVSAGSFIGTFQTVANGLIPGSPYDPNAWVLHTFQFLASGPTSTLTFTSLAPQAIATGPVIDAVSVTAIHSPEPASMLAWSLVIGAGAAGYRLRKRRAVIA